MATGVLVLGTHPVIRGVVRLACEADGDLQVVREASSLEDLDASDAPVPGDPITVAVVDLDGLGADAGAIIDRLRGAGVEAPVLVLTDRSDGRSVLGALRAGVRGYVAKADGLRSIGSAIRRVAAGERVVDPSMEQAAVMELGRFARQAREGSEIEAALTPRESQILLLLADGDTMHQIGRRLGISPRTVETHVGKLYRKLGVRTRVQAVAKAASLGLIDLR
jgi:DNA-binding NarL/FixJ family response regulator